MFIKKLFIIVIVTTFLASCDPLPTVETIVWNTAEPDSEEAEYPNACDTDINFSLEYDLNQVVGITGQQIDNAIAKIRSDSPLIGLGNDIVQIGQELGINPFYIAAHAAWESSWGTSQIAKDKNNLFGYGAYDSCPYECAYSYNSKVESIKEVMQKVKVDYLTEGGKYYNGANLAGMNKKYATDPNWKNGISTIMNSLLNNACESE